MLRKLLVIYLSLEFAISLAAALNPSPDVPLVKRPCQRPDRACAGQVPW